MVKTKARKPVRRKASAHRREPELPFYFKQIDSFLKEARVPRALQPDLMKAKKALAEIVETIYGIEPHQICIGERPLFPPF
jgi:hypothetical protein